MNQFLWLLAWNLCLVIPSAFAAWIFCRLPWLSRRPALCHGIWFLVLLKLVTPPLVPVPLFPAAPSGEPTVVASDPDPDTTGWIDLRASENVGTVASAVSNASERATSIRARIPDTSDFPITVFPDNVPKLDDAPQQVAALRPRGPSMLVTLLGASMLVTICLWFVAIRQVRRISRLLHNASPNLKRSERADRAQSLLAEIADRLFGLRSAPRLVIVGGNVAPMVWANPPIGTKTRGAYVILSQELLESFDDDQLRCVLAHELAHCVRRDHWTNLFGFAVTALFWWHPIAWWARREMTQAAEVCCDTIVVERLRGTRKSYGQTLLKVVDFVRTPQPLLALTFGGSSSLKKRIRMLTLSDVRSHISRRGWCLLVIGCASLALLPARARENERIPETRESRVSAKAPVAEPPNVTDVRPAVVAFQTDESKSDKTSREDGKQDVSSDEPKYYVVGTVLEEESKQPIAKAVVTFLIDGEQKRLLNAMTDAKGTFRAEVPIGNLRVWFPELKPGYWLDPADNTKALATSVEKRIATLDLLAKRGPAWPVQLTVEGGVPAGAQFLVSVSEVEDDALRAKWLKGEPVSFKDPMASAMTRLDESGKGMFTQCGKSGKLHVGVGGSPTSAADWELGAIATELIVDPAFDITKVKSIQPLPGTDKTELIDEQGSKATIGKAQVSLANGLPLLTFRIPRSKIERQEMRGRVVDAANQPIPDVKVRLAEGVKGGGGGELPTETTTGKDGEFQVLVPLIDSNQEIFVNFIFNKPGYACRDSQSFPLPKKSTAGIDVGKFTLQPGYELPIQVIDQDDRPIAGVVVEPSGSYAARHMAIRTKETGTGILKDLPAGTVSIMVMYPGKSDHRAIVVSSRPEENTVTKIRLKTAVTPPTKTVERPKPIAVGQDAPEWKVSTWTDGKTRKLSDYRGHVVVIDFWGVWCGGCVTSIPMMQGLADMYQPQGVVFLGIHTPEGDLEQIAKLKKENGWKAETAIDEGTSESDGTSAARYGVRGYPTVLVIDPNGKIAFNSSIQPEDMNAFMKEMKELADSLKIKLPNPSEKIEGDDEAAMQKLFGAVFRREIDKVLAADKK